MKELTISMATITRYIFYENSELKATNIKLHIPKELQQMKFRKFIFRLSKLKLRKTNEKKGQTTGKTEIFFFFFNCRLST